MHRCKHCRRQIEWARTMNARWIALDAEPTPDGAYFLNWDAAPHPEAIRVLPQTIPAEPMTRHNCHAETCPKTTAARRVA